MKVTRENIIWESHQKHVPTIDDEGGKLWGCFRSCFLQSAAPYTEGVAYKILKNDLGIDLREAAGHTSCGAIGYHGDVTTIETQMVVAARNFAVAHEELGVDNLFSF
ncbi:MAG: heterodisulfide reductase subunit B, partial [Cyanobacteria bacterium]|nr:heterodisulfide reductase subunit B [Cyanobacteria bacterium CG_2015-02_32_10]